jgi:hypothetical protein
MFGLFGFILRVDDAIETAWRDRDWPTLLKLWLATTVAIAVASIVVVCALGFLGVQIARVYYAFKSGGDAAAAAATSAQISTQLSALWDFALKFGAVTAAMGVLHGVLAVLVRTFAGHAITQQPK